MLFPPLRLLLTLATTLFAFASAHAALKPLAPRTMMSLDGTWQIEQGTLDAPPAAFTHTIPVPGLVDMAVPAFTEVGRVSKQRTAFWYRRTFRVDEPIPAIALLKLHKAQNGSQVWLNGKLLGDHPPSFTPIEFDARSLVKQGENVVLVRLGANRESLPTDQVSGFDFEKKFYTPGIYDSVELILSGAPFIRNVQTVPDPIAKTVRLVVEVVAGSQPAEFTLRSEVVADKTKTVAAVSQKVRLAPGELRKLDFTVPLKDAHLWTPEDPFLYEVSLSTGADASRERFGLRCFRYDALLGRDATPAQRRLLRARYVAALTEPHFEEHVKEAFAPIGLMLDFWAPTVASGEKRELAVLTVNDLGVEWSGEVRLRVLNGKKIVSEQTNDGKIPAYVNARFSFAFTAPTAAGEYLIEAALVVPSRPPNRSLRDFKIAAEARPTTPGGPAQAPDDLAPPPVNSDPQPVNP